MAVQATPGQINALMIAERVSAIFSLLGIFFILSTFSLARGFDKPINRLFFFASFSNLGMSVAALIAEDGVSAGQHSSLCQFQAFAIQWYGFRMTPLLRQKEPNLLCRFLGVDTLWALCMGINVYLALFRGWTSERMRRQEWKYFLGCYGCSFVPALTYLFVDGKERGRIYGPALVSSPMCDSVEFKQTIYEEKKLKAKNQRKRPLTRNQLWCWVSPQWDFLRVATLYGVVW